MGELVRYLTPSRTFLLFWLAILIGLVIGSYVALPLSILLWLTAIWIVVAISGQEKSIELVAIIFSALGVGILLWQLTGGETWIHFHWIDTVTKYLLVIRDRVTEQIFSALPEPHGSLLVGILFGNRVKLDHDLVEQFQTVGLSHIVAVSGYNLTILGSNLRTLLRPVLGKKALWLALAVMLAFVLITGAPASIVRAAVMASIAVVAELIGRPNKSVNALLLTASLMAVFQPKIIFDIGFQLSLAATYGLLRLSPIIKPHLVKTKLPKIISGILAESLAATIMTAPIIILYFSRFSTVSLATNVLLLPLVPLLMGLGLTGAILIFIWPLAGSFFIQICWPLLALIIGVTNYFAALEWASVDIKLSTAIVTAVMAVIIAGVEYLRVRQGRGLKLEELWLR